MRIVVFILITYKYMLYSQSLSLKKSQREKLPRSPLERGTCTVLGRGEQRIVHHDGVILHERLGIFASIGAGDDTYQFIVPRIATPALMLYAVIRLLDAIAIRLLRIGTDTSVQVRIVQPEFQSVGVGRIVPDPKVDIVVRKRSPCSERNAAIDIGKNIEAVPVSLDYGQRRMGKHPKEQIAKLTETASHSFADLPLTQYQTFEVSLASSRTADMTPDGEGLPGTYDHTMQLGDGQSQIGSFVLLQVHVHILQPAHNERPMLHDRIGTTMRIVPL